MRVVPRYGLFFTAFYALLILLTGTLVYLFSGRAQALFVTPPLLALYLAVALRRPLRRRRAARAPLPGEWREFLLARSAFFRGLDPGGRERFARDVRLFLDETRIAGTGGSPVSWRVRLLVAAAAAAMLHGRPDWEPPMRDGVTVYPGHAFDRNYRAGKGNIAGQAPAGGPLLVAERSLLEGFAGARDGANVMIHELAHYFDLEARKAGMELGVASGKRESWPVLIGGEYGRHDFSASALPAYAAQNEAEFFACASEMFFENPGRLQRAHPALYSLLEEFYGQDPRSVLGNGAR